MSLQDKMTPQSPSHLLVNAACLLVCLKFLSQRYAFNSIMREEKNNLFSVDFLFYYDNALGEHVAASDSLSILGWCLKYLFGLCGYQNCWIDTIQGVGALEDHLFL